MDISNNPTIKPKVYDSLPDWFKEILNTYDDRRKDILLLSS